MSHQPQRDFAALALLFGLNSLPTQRVKGSPDKSPFHPAGILARLSNQGAIVRGSPFSPGLRAPLYPLMRTSREKPSSSNLTGPKCSDI